MTVVKEAFSDWQLIVDNSGNFTTVSAPYFVFECDTEDNAIDAVRTASPVYYENLQRTSIELKERINLTTFSVVVDYANTQNDVNTKPKTAYSFSVAAGTEHLTNSRKTRNSYPSSAPDFKGGIGYDSKSEQFQGVDIYKAVYTFQETHYISKRIVNNRYKVRLSLYVNTYNHTTFRGLSRGQVLLAGVSGNYSGTGKYYEVTFSFAVMVNRPSFKIGDITVHEKLGWDYMWVEYKDDIVNGPPRRKIKIPIGVYIEKVYRATNFRGLGIG